MRAWLDGVGKPSLGRATLRRPARFVAPALSLVALVIAGLITFQLYLNPIFIVATREQSRPSDGPGIVVHITPAPSNVVVTNPRIAVPGTLVYVKTGNLWVQSGTTARQITQSVAGSAASQPAWSPDGQWIYFIDTRVTTGRWYDPNAGGAIVRYRLLYPVLCRVKPDGTGEQDVLSSLITSKSLKTFYWLRQPSISPDGTKAAVISDGPKGQDTADTVLHFVNLQTRKLLPALGLPERSPLGHSDPTYSPDGSRIAYVMEGRSGTKGAPSIWLYNVAKKTGTRLANGYRGPSWSPDGKYLAATRVKGGQLDVVVLDANTGKQVAQVTSDGNSWAPVWSPKGDELVYMHLTGAVVDLYMVHVAGSEGSFVFKIEPNLTEYSSLDGSSRAAWYIPADQTPSPSPSPSPSPTPSPSPSPSPSRTPSAS